MVGSPEGSQDSDSLFRRTVQRLYANSRPQFHPALYVLLYAGMFVFYMSIFNFVVNRLFGWDLALDPEILGLFLGMVVTAELAKGHWKSWTGKPHGEWSFPAIAAGGAALGLVFSVVQALRWGLNSWVEYATYIFGGIGFYLLLGWLFRYQEREEQKRANDN
jgi:hypothetical protein